MPSSWIKTQSVNLAAALSTLGIPLKIDQTSDLRWGKTWKTILLGLEALPLPEDMGAEVVKNWEGDSAAVQEAVRIETPSAGARLKTSMIMELINTGRLEKADPVHPVLDGLRAIHNRECLLNWTKKDTRYCVAKSSFAPRSQFIPGEEPPSVKASAAATAFKTGDMKIVAALAVFGVPVARIEGGGDRHSFFCANTGHDLGVPPVDAHQLVTAYRQGALPVDHPFRWAMQALINRERILDVMHRQKQMVLIRQGGSGLGAIVPSDATNICMDVVKKHFQTL